MLEMQFRNSEAKALLSKIQMPAFCRLWSLPETPFPILASTMIRIGNLHEIQGRENNNKRMCLLLFKKLRILKLSVIGFGVQGRTIIVKMCCVSWRYVGWVDGETGCREFRVRGSDCAPLATKEDNKGIARKVHRRTPNLDHFSTGTAFSKVTIYCLSN